MSLNDHMDGNDWAEKLTLPPKRLPRTVQKRCSRLFWIIRWIAHGAIIGAGLLFPIGFCFAIPFADNWLGQNSWLDVLRVAFAVSLMGAVYGGLASALFLGLGLVVSFTWRAGVKVFHLLKGKRKS